MKEHFHQIIRTRLNISPDIKILLTVSGGIDSMVMAELFSGISNPLIIAHCNFSLRGYESNGDEQFVRNYCRRKGIECYVKNFDTISYAENNNISIQMAARELRYDWFEVLRKETGSDFIAVAHNRDDQIETFFINLLRGTGIRGLSGMTHKGETLLRPLLDFSRKEIVEFAQSVNLSWREDRSNASVKYKRNKLRHDILPQFRELNPSFEATMIENIKNIKLSKDLYIHYTEGKKKELLKKTKNGYTLGIPQLTNEPFIEAICYEILTEFNFTVSDIRDIIRSLSSPSGKRFYSSSHQLIKDRETLIIEAFTPIVSSRFYIEENQQTVTEPISLFIKKLPVKNFSIPASRDIACLDADKLDFPLIIKKWQSGDYFIPLGMKNFKKLSDYFIDNKFSLPQKDASWLLCCGKNIVWLIGHRIDDRYKITPSTREIIMISYIEK